MKVRRLWFVILLWSTSAGAGDLELTAPLEPARSADVYARMTGQVERIAVLEGDRVAAGDTLALLEEGILRLAEAAAGVACRKARGRLERAEQMWTRGLISVQQVESIRYEAEAACIRWEKARFVLAKAVVLAPMGGLVARCGVRVGDLTSPRMLLFRIIDPEDLVADLFVPADRLDLVGPGQAVTARSTLSPEPLLSGRVLRVSPVIDAESGTCRAVAAFPGAGKWVRPGTPVRVVLTNRAGK